MSRLKDKVCVITGATSGIGKRTAEIFAAEGAKLVIAGRREAEGRAIARALGGACDFVRTDVTLEAEVEALIAFALEKHGRIDCLFNNAGGPGPVGGIEEIPVAGFDAAMAVLVRSVVLGMKHAAPAMLRQKSGSIINNGSVAAHRAGYSSSLVYSAAKAAVVHLTRCVAMQLGEGGVRVNSISPGFIPTGIFGKALGMAAEEAERSAETVKSGLGRVQPIPRAGLTDDVALAAVFLASDDSTFVNGHDLVVDGGMIGGRGWTQHQETLRGLKRAFGLDG
ncbi:MAG TPA: SDR family oxidoreductase [Thermoanaerobaculia bacterium]|nr:SDR family oxidoreductase [Thermoanaerobaculia bacterium]